jgi:amidase
MAPKLALHRDDEDITEEFLLLEGNKPPSQPDMPSIFRLPKLKGHDLFEVTVDEIQHLYSAGAFTAEEYVQFCLGQIQATNPYLEAVIETNPDALTIARQMDIERKNGRVRGPLHGIPVLVKDVGTEC